MFLPGKRMSPVWLSPTASVRRFHMLFKQVEPLFFVTKSLDRAKTEIA
jgi:hypothetical protein